MHPAPAPTPARPEFSARSCRVAVLVAIIGVLSMADLYLTLLYVTTTGMPEANPLARGIMATGTPRDLIVWKLTTVAIVTGILFWKRRAFSAEIGAWIGALILGALMVHWVSYSRETARLAGATHLIDSDYVHSLDPRWVFMESTATP